MDSRILVPATPALLAGWCGPVVVLPDCVPVVIGREFSLNGHTYRDSISLTADSMWSGGLALDRIALDLSRAECRDRIVRALIAVLWPDDRLDRVALDGGAWSSDRFDGWVLHTWNVNWSAHFRSGPSSREICAPHHPYTWSIRVPALADLCAVDGLEEPPEPGSRLPDGSRRVDALALAAVAREVLRCAP